MTNGQDFESTEKFIKFCEAQGAEVTHESGNTWVVSTPKGNVRVKRSCQAVPKAQRGVLSYFAWGLGLLGVIGGVIVWLMGVA